MNNTDNDKPDLETTMRRKYYWLVAISIFIGTLVVALGAGTANLYWHRPWSDAVTVLLILGVWIAFKRLSRAYQEGRLFDDEGNLVKFKEMRTAKKTSTGHNERDAATSRPSSAQLSAKDQARLAEIERKRALRQAKEAQRKD